MASCAPVALFQHVRRISRGTYCVSSCNDAILLFRTFPLVLSSGRISWIPLYCLRRPLSPLPHSLILGIFKALPHHAETNTQPKVAHSSFVETGRNTGQSARCTGRHLTSCLLQGVSFSFVCQLSSCSISSLDRCVAVASEKKTSRTGRRNKRVCLSHHGTPWWKHMWGRGSFTGTTHPGGKHTGL